MISLKLPLQNYIDSYRAYLALAGLVAGVIILILLVLVPSVQGIFTMSEKLDGFKKTEADLQKKRSLLESLDTAEMTSNLQIAQIALPGEKDIPAILNSIQNISAVTQFSINDVGFVPGPLNASVSGTRKINNGSSDRHGVPTIVIKLGGRGTRQQLENFLNTVETSRRIVDMDSLSVQNSEDGTDYLSASFSLYVYYLPAITQITKLDAPIAQITDKELATLSKIGGFTDLTISSYASQNQPGTTTVTLGKADLFSN